MDDQNVSNLTGVHVLLVFDRGGSGVAVGGNQQEVARSFAATTHVAPLLVRTHSEVMLARVTPRRLFNTSCVAE
jgi:hypothetical protein